MSKLQCSDQKCIIAQKVERALKLRFLNNLDFTLKKKKERRKKLYVQNSNVILVFKKAMMTVECC